ncbi:MAG: DUF6531 domain-containing protein [Gammaproteobacteria bacterium]|nr:DUF6531 domain-containing protein [Gammaproteobacteria bacterium]
MKRILFLILISISSLSHSYWKSGQDPLIKGLPSYGSVCVAYMDKHITPYVFSVYYEGVIGQRSDIKVCMYRSKRYETSSERSSASEAGFYAGCNVGDKPVGYTCVQSTHLKSGGCDGTMDGNPCNAATGNKFQTEVDYDSKNLKFIRHYNSLIKKNSALSNQWTHNFLSFLSISDTIQVHRPDGKILEFSNDTGSWISDADITNTLTQLGSNWKFKTNNDSIETYNDAGQLLTTTTREGKTTSYTYNADNLLEQVTGPFGRTLGFAYDASNRLIILTTPENTAIHYTYDDLPNNLTSVIYPDNTPNDLSDNPRKIYHYEKVNFPNHLTGITDENNVRYATWAYDENGLATLSEHTNSAEKIELTYNTDETTTVTDSLGRIKKYTFETHFSLRKPKTIEYTYNDGHQMVTKQKTYTYYPDNGRVKEVTDYNGHITYYEYNNRGLITLETQGKGTPEEYNVFTTWHPSYRLPVTRTYPNRTEIYSYNSTGLLINTTQRM